VAFARSGDSRPGRTTAPWDWLVVDRSGVMSGSGAIFKRCGCRDTAGRRLNKNCPRLAERGHGTWTFHTSATNLLGRCERVRRSGFPSQAAARRARDEWLAATGADRTARSWTVERWLRYWMAHPHQPPPDHQAALQPRRGTGPHPAPGQAVFGRPGRPAAAGGVRRDRPDHQRQGPAAVGLRDGAPAHHPAGGAEPGRPGRGTGNQPGPAHRDPRLPKAPRPGVDRRAGTGVAAHRPAPTGGRVDRRTPGHVPGHGGR
jgi:hypothetical protein